MENKEKNPLPQTPDPAQESLSPMKNRSRFQANKKYFTICIYAIITFCICLLLFKFINNWQDTKAHIADMCNMLSPFLIAFLIAYFINPLIRNIDRILFSRTLKDKFVRLHRVVSLIIAYIIFIGMIALLLKFVIPQVGTSILELIKQAPTMYDNMVNGINEFIIAHPNLDLDYIQDFVNSNLPVIFSYAQDFMSSMLPVIYSAGLSIISWIINIVLAFVISCYLMWDKENLLRSIKKIMYALLKENHAAKVIAIVKKCNDIFSGFIIGKAIDSLIIGILCFILMCILKLPYAILISVVVGVTNMIPYFGPFIGAIPGALILLIISPKLSLIFIIMVFALQQFDGNILGPKILGDSTGLQPIWIIFAITVGGYTAGPVGMFLGVPITAVIAYLLNCMIEYLIRKRHLSPEVAQMLAPPQKPAKTENSRHTCPASIIKRFGTRKK